MIFELIPLVYDQRVDNFALFVPKNSKPIKAVMTLIRKILEILIYMDRRRSRVSKIADIMKSSFKSGLGEYSSDERG